MKKILHKMKRIIQLTYNFIFKNRTRILTVRIILMSAFYRMTILFLPMSRLKQHLGVMDQESSKEEELDHYRIAYWIGVRVERVCDKTPWESKCLVKALIAQKLLHEKGIHSTLYLGVRKENDQMVAHAWLRCGDLYVTGGNGEGHAITAFFYR